MVIIRAIGRHLRSYPHARFLDHEDLLKHPLLDDHLSRGKATVRRTLGVVCDSCVVFIYVYLVHALVIYVLILFLGIHSFMLLFNS